MNKHDILKNMLIFKLLILWSVQLFAADSGSTGADGAFSPTTSQVVDMTDHPNGIYNFTTINIPSGVTITFVPNAANTPVVFLASGDVVIDGDINISGQDVNSFGVSLPGPGGYRGGRGGSPMTHGANGSGPGGAPGAIFSVNRSCGGLGGGYGLVGTNGSTALECAQTAGVKYGSPSLVPLFGGSGGAGGAGSTQASATTIGGSGGAGGGALLIASSGTLTLNGNIIADGGNGQNFINGSSSSVGGGGSGGGVRLVATSLAGNGDIDVSGGIAGTGGSSTLRGGVGGYGRVRLEGDNLAFTGTVSPVAAVDAIVPAQAIFPANIPTISITTVAGETVPVIPSGSNDVVLPPNVTNPVTIGVSASNVPLTSTVTVTLTPVIGNVVTATSTALTGSEASSTATASITLPQGPSVLTASVSFSITVAMGESFSPFAEGELVASMRVDTTPGQGSLTTFITETGKEYTWPSNAIAFTN